MPMLTTHAFDDDHLKEECGIIGIFGVEQAATLTVLGLHALQHRGQEAAGIVSHDGESFHSHRAMGHVADNFSAESVVGPLKGRAAIGHVRYSTTGETALRNVQPFFAEYSFGGLALAHNGNLTNALVIRQELKKRGCIFASRRAPGTPGRGPNGWRRGRMCGAFRWARWRSRRGSRGASPCRASMKEWLSITPVEPAEWRFIVGQLLGATDLQEWK